jgi:hypothetical protein
VSVEQRWVTGIVHPGAEISQTAYIQHHDTTYEVVCPWCAQTLGTLAASTPSLTIMQELAALQQLHFTTACPYLLYWKRGGTLRLAVRIASTGER